MPNFPTPPNVVVSIDDNAFQFADMEVPESIRGGGAQQLNIIKLPGGQRIIQAMGSDDLPLTWSGLFLGGTLDDPYQAANRCRYLDSLRKEGAVHRLTWFQYVYHVVIKEFTWEWQRFYKIRYSITLEIISDDTLDITNPAPVASPDGAIAGDNATAQSLGAAVGDSTLTSLLGNLDAAIQNVSSFANATTAQINSVKQPLQAVEQQVQILEASSANVLKNISTFGGLFPANPVANRIAKLNAQIANAQQQLTLSQLSATVGRMSKNLSLINSASNAATVAVGGTTLFRVAATSYGDATRWSTIAQANGLTDPQVTTNKVLTIPTNPGPTGGAITT